MRPILALAMLAIALSGCANTKFAENIQGLVNAGCKGTVDVTGGVASATGLSPGAGHVEGEFHGSCDAANRALTPPS